MKRNLCLLCCVLVYTARDNLDETINGPETSPRQELFCWEEIRKHGFSLKKLKEIELDEV